MKIIEPYVEILTPIDQDAILKHLEACGRTCYKSEDRITPGSAEKFVRMLIRNGHESVLEHCSITVRFVTDRGVSHELVRHRLASYSQESTRYCNYSGEITVIRPPFFDPERGKYRLWKNLCEECEEAYQALIAAGSTPQEARAVLPNSLKTEIVMTANIREWRTVLRQRTSPAAHPQIRQVMQLLLDEFHARLPVLFGDIGGEA